MPEPKEPTVVRYVGQGGAYLANVPATDLTATEIASYGYTVAALVASGLYKARHVTAPADKADVQPKKPVAAKKKPAPRPVSRPAASVNTPPPVLTPLIPVEAQITTPPVEIEEVS